jgi:7-carboxy-7-deazaguanine synthase
MKLARLHDGPEIFHTLQGEGVSVGSPAIFVRSSLCNLHCHWCDTDYTWNFEGTPWTHEKDADPGYRKHSKAAVILEMEPAEVARRVSVYPCRRLVLTGGEPLLQQDAWLEMIAALPDGEEWKIEVETNGTRLPSAAMAAAVSQFNVSPKLAHSGMAESLRLVPEVLGFFARCEKAWFKFVLGTADDAAEILAIQHQHLIPSERILVMPEGRTAAALDRHASAVAAACLEHGWRFSDRLHVRLWGEKRGV